MDLELSADETALAEGTRSFCKGRVPLERVRDLEKSGGVDRSLWRELGETGVFSLKLPEADGGAGLGMVAATVAFEELGRALVPGPVVACHLAAGMIEGAATGEKVVGLVTRDSGHPGPALVEHWEGLDVLLVLDGEGVWLLDRGEIEGASVERPLDPLTPVHVVERLPRGDLLLGSADAAAWRRCGATLVAALCLGVAEATMDLAVAYAKHRHQFDRPIGSFQSVKHMLADMLVRTEVARASVYASAATLDDPAVGDVDRAVTVGKLEAGDAAMANGQACVQVHGGMGFTWDMDAHLYLKRAHVLDTLFGSAQHQAETMARYLDGSFR